MSDDVRAGLRVSAVSVVWTVLTSAVAIALGIDAGSLVLVAFGVTGLLDAAGSAALVVHFRHALHHEAMSEARERVAHQVVSIGLVGTGVATGAESVRRLITGAVAHRSAAGAVVAAVSIVVLAALALRKRRIASRVGSPALAADGWLSATGALLAIVTVVGAVLSGHDGTAWVDPTAALVIGATAVVVGVTSRR
jgi:divalent metal cation (Fe/Co/Zn/Cd) transporter